MADVPPSDARFDELYRKHFPALMRVAFLMTGSNETAEDAVQETFIRCRDRLGDLDHPPSYLRAAVVNQCRTAYRKSARVLPDVPEPIVGMPTELIELRDALARLPWNQRGAIVLRYFADVPDIEIARTLHCRPSTVRSHIRRGIATLREALT